MAKAFEGLESPEEEAMEQGAMARKPKREEKRKGKRHGRKMKRSHGR